MRLRASRHLQMDLGGADFIRNAVCECAYEAFKIFQLLADAKASQSLKSPFLACSCKKQDLEVLEENSRQTVMQRVLTRCRFRTQGLGFRGAK